jgi:hypothetical protein
MKTELPPQKIFFKSDETEARLVIPQPKGNAKLDAGVYLYQYTKAHENTKPFPMSLAQIEKLKSVKLLVTE